MSSNIDSLGLAKPEGQWHHGDLRESLIQYGLILLDKQGPQKISLREAAKMAGVSQSAPSHHFTDKNGLLAELATRGFEQLIVLRRTELAKHDKNDHIGRLHTVLRVCLEYGDVYPNRFELMYGGTIGNRKNYPNLIATGYESFGILREVLTPLLPAADDYLLTNDEVTRYVWSSIYGAAQLHINSKVSPKKAWPETNLAKITDDLHRIATLLIISVQNKVDPSIIMSRTI